MSETKKIDRRSKVEKFKENPFRADAVACVELKHKTLTFGTGESLVNPETGEYHGEAAYKQTRVVDSAKFVMMYQAYQTMYWQLTSAAQKVMRAVLYQISEEAINKDQIYLNWDVADEIFKAEGMKVGRSTYFKGISELSEKRVVAPATRDNIYFFNPALIFNGNRAIFAQEIVKADPTIEVEAQKIRAQKALDASRDLDANTLKTIGDSIKR
ncbi:hypothetical protein [Vibrio splendidus]|uniref:Plasmid replication protein RepL domain-containing protein n=1 Tax=Vibrio splendidus TaxID=29497 RepID=A0A2N7JHX6_VIBSP|nr:hypothetical protein [Vibrio splendidus]PMM39245.1 hypothetical protein BCT54_02125 [Vibrio splendidus]